ncbi:MAG TPA: hypothetical protein VGV09_04990 [Steroidobacteraceae bacterium]|nr:hypothetical protein [Steroidobacteraceae bacterium]
MMLPSPFPAKEGVLWVLEAPQTRQEVLSAKLLDGTYSKPFILDQGGMRALHFDLDAVQSLMQKENPYTLCLAYTRMMMAFLLFNQAPRRVLLLGLGGGSLAKFCYRRLSAAGVTVVESNPDVIALRQAFEVPQDGRRFRIVRANCANYLAGAGPAKDVILADACDRAGVAPELDSTHFYRNAYRRLSAAGIFVMNLCADGAFPSLHLTRMREVFGDVITLWVGQGSNMIAFAFKYAAEDVRWEELRNCATSLKHRYGLDFPRYARLLAQEWALRSA